MVFSRASLKPTGFALELQGILWNSGKMCLAGKAKAVRFIPLVDVRGVCK